MHRPRDNFTSDVAADRPIPDLPDDEQHIPDLVEALARLISGVVQIGDGKAGDLPRPSSSLRSDPDAGAGTQAQDAIDAVA